MARTIAGGGALLILAMLLFVAFGANTPPGDPNMGAGILLIEFLISLGLFVGVLVRDYYRKLDERATARNG